MLSTLDWERCARTTWDCPEPIERLTSSISPMKMIYTMCPPLDPYTYIGKVVDDHEP